MKERLRGSGKSVILAESSLPETTCLRRQEAMSQQATLHRYEGRGGTVTYDVKRCVHAGECSRRLPAVFNSKARPWINPEGADTSALAGVVERCPSGALHVERPDGVAEAIPDRNTATLTAGGPTYVRGDLAVMGQDSTSRFPTRESRFVAAASRRTSRSATAATRRSASRTKARCARPKDPPLPRREGACRFGCAPTVR